MNTEQERAEFEAWANGRCELHLVNSAGRYSSATTQFAWEAYQAGRAAAPTPPAQASGQAPAAAMPDEIEGLRAHVALLKAALAQAERENDELRAQPAAATTAPTLQAENKRLANALRSLLRYVERCREAGWLVCDDIGPEEWARYELEQALSLPPEQPAGQGAMVVSELEGITIDRDLMGTMHIKCGDFDFIQIQYQYPYTDNASTRRLAERIARMLVETDAEAPIAQTDPAPNQQTELVEVRHAD